MNELLIMFLLTAYNATVACTEGWKWRKDAHRPDNNKLIGYDNYHVWRSMTSLVVILLCLVVATNILSLLLSWIGSILLYERTMSFVENDNWNKKRSPFHILKWNIPRPPVWVEWVSMVACYVLNVIVIF